MEDIPGHEKKVELYIKYKNQCRILKVWKEDYQIIEKIAFAAV